MSRSPSEPNDGVNGRPGRRRRLRLGVTRSEERRRILRGLFGHRDAPDAVGFALMLGLSVVIAVMGLTANSTAIIIGAMLIAPLMTPVMGFAAALVMGWPKRMASMMGVVVGASVGSIALAWLLATVMPSLSMNREILQRTAPDLRDLLVAVAAGAAGAYATSREEVSAALPGVAVAVALVPPLAAIGVVLSAGRRDLAEGAALLYLANLAAIIVAGAAVLLLTGFVPRARFQQVSRRVAGGFAVALLGTALIGVPLTLRSISFAQHASDVDAARARVLMWLGPGTDLRIARVGIDGTVVNVDLEGPDEPPAIAVLQSALARDLGKGTTASVHWLQRSDISAATTRIAAPHAAIREAIQTWLQDAAEDGPTNTIDSIDVNGAQLRIALVGPQQPPSVSSLVVALAERFGTRPDVTIRWTQQQVYDSNAPSGTLDVPTLARAAAENWTHSYPGLRVDDVTVTGTGITVDLIGPQAPPAVTALVVAVQKATKQTAAVKIRYIQQITLS